ncbi:MAG: hypothetical protein HY600_01935, partial [Candidatus Omnitrophica bacterium]|nr:hypothetical protein [Candidatus Omnitrophota bacterium]
PPTPAPQPTYGDVVFLGAIMAPASTPGPAARGRPRHRPLDPDPLPPEPLEGLHRSDAAPIPPLPAHLFHTEQPLPHAITTVQMTPRRAEAPVWIRGPARLRALRRRPPFAPYLQRASLTRLRAHDMPSTVELELKFLLAPDGAVHHVEMLRSTGDPRLDLVGARYLADWQFAPLDVKTPKTGPDPWGRVTLRLDLEPAGS